MHRDRRVESGIPEKHVVVNSSSARRVLLFRTGDMENAVLQFLNAARNNPDDPIPLFNLAAIYQDSGRPDLAMKLYTRVLQLNPGDADASSALQTLIRHN